MEEKILVQQARQGNQQALAQLLETNYRMMMGYFMKITLDKPVAEDLVQETMVRAIEKLKLYDERFKFSTWLITIGTNIYRDQLRQRHRVSEADFEAIPDLRGVVDPELKTDLRAALRKLGTDKRITIVLRYFLDYSYEEIAGILKVPVGTVRSRLHNGIEELQRGLAIVE